MSVYFAQSGPYVKVGYSAEPLERCSTVTINVRRPKDLARGADVDLLGWIPGDREVEEAWHRRFAADHVAGEWFYLDPAAFRDLIWADPRGVDLYRMSAVAVFAAVAHPELSRADLHTGGIAVEATPLARALDAYGAPAGAA